MTVSLCAFMLSSALVSGYEPIISDSFQIPVGDYRYIQFGFDRAQADDPRVEGTLSALPDTLQVEVLIFAIDDFNRWVSAAGDVDTLYFAEMNAGSLRADLPGFGDFVLVISNRGNWSAAEVAADLRLAFEGSGVAYNPLVFALKVVLVMLAAGAFLIIVIGAVVRIRKRSRRNTIRRAGVDAGRDRR